MIWPTDSRPSVPAWRAVVATAVVLVASLLTGWVVIRGKVSAPAIELGEPQVLETLGVRVALPVDWGRITKTLQGISFVEVTEPGEVSTRRLLLARWPSEYVPHRRLDRSWKLDFVEAGLGALHATADPEPRRLGPLVGWQSEGLWVDKRSREAAVVRVAWAPPGRVFLIAHLAPVPLKGPDRAFFERFADGIELPEVRLSEDLGAAGERVGIRLDVPSGAGVFGREAPSVARMDLVPTWSGSGDEVSGSDWHVTVFRTWARDGDDLESLVTAYRAEQLHDLFLDEPVERVDAGVNTAWRSGARVPERWPADLQEALEVWAVRHRAGDAAMIVGRSPGARHAELRKRCESLARSLRLSKTGLVPTAEELDRNAAAIVREIGDKGLSHWWTEAEVTTWYAIRTAGRQGFGWSHRQRRQEAGRREKGFQGGGLNRIRFDLLGKLRHQDNLYRWWIDDGAEGFRFNQWLPAIDEEDRAIRLTDQRVAGDPRLSHYIRAGEQRYQGALETPETFLPDPVYQLGLFLLSQRSAGTAAGFSMVGSSERMLHRRVCRSLGRLEEDEDGRGGPVYGATARLDCEPTLSRYLFDRTGRLLRVEEGRGYTMEHASKAEIEDLFGDAAVVTEILETYHTSAWLGAGIDAETTASTRPTTPR